MAMYKVDYEVLTHGRVYVSKVGIVESNIEGEENAIVEDLKNSLGRIEKKPKNHIKIIQFGDF